MEVCSRVALFGGGVQQGVIIWWMRAAGWDCLVDECSRVGLFGGGVQQGEIV